MKNILLFFVTLFSSFVGITAFAQNSDDLIKRALADPNMSVNVDQDGNTTIKKRTPKSENPPDETEYRYTYNLQRMFYVGMVAGELFVTGTPEASKQGSAYSSTSGQAGFEAGFRPPFKYAKRFLFGGNIITRNSLRVPADSSIKNNIKTSENYISASPEKDGFVTETHGTEIYNSIFAEYDALIIPGEKAKAVFSMGIYKGFASSSTDVQGPLSYKYTDAGVTARVRAIVHGNDTWDLTPFIAFRYGSRNIHTLYGGLMFNFGDRMMVKRKVEK